MTKLDQFIETSTEFLAAYPATTLSITYKNKSKVKGGKIDKPKHESVVSIKLYDGKSGKLIKYKTSKIKEFNRILNFIGPKGIHMGDSHQIGLSSIMSNTKFDENDEQEPVSNEPTPAPEEVQAVKKKNKKKKKKN